MTLRHARTLGSFPVIFLCLLLITGCSQPQTAAPQTTQQTAPTPPPAASQQTAVTEISASDMMNLMLDLEDQFQLQDVIANQSGETLVIRFKAPTITGDELYTGLAQIFAWLNEKIPAHITGIDLVFTIQNVDSMVVHAERSDIKNWKAGKLDNNAFIKKFQKTSLL